MAVPSTPPPPPSVLNENMNKAKTGNDCKLLRKPSTVSRTFEPKNIVSTNASKKPISDVKWDYRDVFYCSFIGAVHVLCLFAPFTFTWDRLVLGYVLYILTGACGITFSYHRNLAHRSFKLPRYLEYFFAYLGLQAYQGDPIFWVSTHRHQHKVTDTERDPHSPTESFMFAHIYWLFDRKKTIRKGVNIKNVGDLTRQPYYQFLEKTVVLHAWLLAGILYSLGGFPYIFWGMGVRTVWSYHITFLVNSACHTWGRQRWNTGDLSRNNWFVAMLSFGEGWHNNHHAFEYSARQGLEWWEIDVTYYMIKVLEYIGVATDVKVPSKHHLEKMAL